MNLSEKMHNDEIYCTNETEKQNYGRPIFQQTFLATCVDG